MYLVLTQEVDIALTGLTVTPFRQTVVNFSSSFHEEASGIAIKVNKYISIIALSFYT